ncbi:DUF4188 domain-containing protein [Halomontanus rarus]|uniref:DUF4188 domain-containing protein n=1 Tax=Halomontanus rarus TaxID=3034020 RepID=UPI0023E8765B|nr:DUF4188 domain-containing protein [Halovivax sp. TS33]
MSKIHPGRLAGELDGDFVVFVLGLRIHTLWKVHRWLPIPFAMNRMLEELEADPDSGFLGYQSQFGIRDHLYIQYWDSFEALRAYAWDPECEHYPAIGAFHRDIGPSDDVGIWHETYLVDDQQYEAVYLNMQPHGLGAAGDLEPAVDRRKSAAGRLGKTAGDDVPMDDDGTVTSPDEYDDAL